MRILVCVKWVPILSKLRFDPATRRLVRAGVPGEVSAFDLRALGCATALRDEHGGEVVVLTMGGSEAAEGLRECLALGADRGVHLMDAALVGSDTLATARALAGALRREAPDLVLLGRTSVDAETGQVGPELAELLDWPQVTQARRLVVSPAAGTFEAERETDEGFETVTGPLPAVVTAAEDLAEERFPGKSEREAARDKPIATIALADVGVSPESVGQIGSPTWVAGVEEVTVERRGEIVTGDGPAAQVRALGARLRALGAFAEAADVAPLPAAPATSGPPLWVVAEFGGEGPRSVTRELLAKARELASVLGGAV